MSNLPDNCQGNDLSFPWNEEDPIECTLCHGGMTQDDDGDYICDDSENCEGVVICDQGEGY